MDRFLNKVNLIYGAIVALLTAIFGQYWFLFAGFLVLNVIDYGTGIIKAKYFKGNESSKVGAKGIFKKVSYWLVIGIAFFIASCFVELGIKIGVELNFVVMFGWFTLATYLVNEIRSILENLVEMGVKVPAFLIKGLEVADRAIDKITEGEKMSKLICLDAGHGGTDPGACGFSLKEKDITLKMVKKVGRLLEKSGFNVVYTRTTDTYVKLGERCRIANSKACDCFISIHNNSAVNTQSNGIETLCYTKNNLAFYIQQNLIGELKLTDRGVKERKDLYVLNSTDMTAVLVELGFISNPENNKLLNYDSFLDRASEAIIKGVCRYLGVAFKGGDNVDKVKRIYKYGKNEKVIEVLNVEGKNYVPVRELAELMGKKVSYNSGTKMTEIRD